MKNIPIFIFSCDKNRDVLAHTLESIKKYWPEAFDSLFVGVNSIHENKNLKYKELYAKKSCWRNETLTQLDFLNKIFPGEDVIVYLDDFLLLKAVDNSKIEKYVSLFRKLHIKYLRLTPYESSILHKITKQKYVDIHMIPDKHLYPHSLQVAIWNREYLRKIITESKDIWDFENVKKSEAELYSSSQKLIIYKHIVEKGRWNYWAKKLCIKHINFFEPNQRGIRSGIDKVIIDNLRRISFSIFGYTLTRLKRMIG